MVALSTTRFHPVINRCYDRPGRRKRFFSCDKPAPHASVNERLDQRSPLPTGRSSGSYESLAMQVNPRKRRTITWKEKAPDPFAHRNR